MDVFTDDNGSKLVVSSYFKCCWTHAMGLHFRRKHRTLWFISCESYSVLTRCSSKSIVLPEKPHQSHAFQYPKQDFGKKVAVSRRFQPSLPCPVIQCLLNPSFKAWCCSLKVTTTTYHPPFQLNVFITYQGLSASWWLLLPLAFSPIIFFTSSLQFVHSSMAFCLAKNYSKDRSMTTNKKARCLQWNRRQNAVTYFRFLSRYFMWDKISSTNQ